MAVPGSNKDEIHRSAQPLRQNNMHLLLKSLEMDLQTEGGLPKNNENQTQQRAQR
jgi:hypothetical protein